LERIRKELSWNYFREKSKSLMSTMSNCSFIYVLIHVFVFLLHLLSYLTNSVKYRTSLDVTPYETIG
jgi:predicted phosphatase